MDVLLPGIRGYAPPTEGGKISNNKGISLPGMNVSVPALSDKDIADLEFALSLSVDIVALSFVRSSLDARLVHDVMDRVGVRAPVIAKLEKPEAVTDLEASVRWYETIFDVHPVLDVPHPGGLGRILSSPDRQLWFALHRHDTNDGGVVHNGIKQFGQYLGETGSVRMYCDIQVAGGHPCVHDPSVIPVAIGTARSRLLDPLRLAAVTMWR